MTERDRAFDEMVRRIWEYSHTSGSIPTKTNIWQMSVGGDPFGVLTSEDYERLFTLAQCYLPKAATCPKLIDQSCDEV